MFYVVYVEGKIRETIDKTGKPNKYGKPKYFKTRGEAEMWTLKRVYTGMTHHYEIIEINNITESKG